MVNAKYYNYQIRVGWAYHAIIRGQPAHTPKGYFYLSLQVTQPVRSVESSIHGYDIIYTSITEFALGYFFPAFTSSPHGCKCLYPSNTLYPTASNIHQPQYCKYTDCMNHSTNYTINTMNSIKEIPPFPEDIPTAPLLRLSLAKLLAHDAPEVERLMRASEEIGFFYLDLQDSEHGRGLLNDADALFGLGEELFALDLAEKERFDFSAKGSYFGYKGVGKGVVDREGNLDRNEFYNVGPCSYLSLYHTYNYADGMYGVGIKRRPPKHNTQ